MSIAWVYYAPGIPRSPILFGNRPEQNHFNAPIYLLTFLSIESAQQAWKTCFVYIPHLNIEQAFRFGKPGLAMESLSLWF